MEFAGVYDDPQIIMYADSRDPLSRAEIYKIADGFYFWHIDEKFYQIISIEHDGVIVETFCSGRKLVKITG